MKLPQLIEKEVSVTAFRRRPAAVYEYLTPIGHIVIFTRRGKRKAVMMSVETYELLVSLLTGDERSPYEEVLYNRRKT